METVNFNVPATSCSNCASKIENSLMRIKGVTGVTVDLKTQSVKVDFRPEQLKADDIAREVVNMGYEVVQ